MGQQLKVDDFLDELRRQEKKEDFMAAIKQYEQRFYDAFESQANRNYPPELQKQTKILEQLAQQQIYNRPNDYDQRQYRPPIDKTRSYSANKLPVYEQYQDPYQFQKTPQRQQVVDDPFKRVDDPFKRQQQIPTPIFQGQQAQYYSPHPQLPQQFPTTQVSFQGQPPTAQFPQQPVPQFPNLQPQSPNIQYQQGPQIYQQYDTRNQPQPIFQGQQQIPYYDQTIPIQGARSTQPQQLDQQYDFIQDIRAQRMQKQAQYK
ncbi:hypothetical protein pb186bvf_004040 [Paramecium bursaria]